MFGVCTGVNVHNDNFTLADATALKDPQKVRGGINRLGFHANVGSLIIDSIH